MPPNGSNKPKGLHEIIEIKTLVCESILNPPKIVVTNIIFLQLSFLVTYGYYILDYFGLF